MGTIFSNDAFELRSDGFVEGDRAAKAEGGILTCADGTRLDIDGLAIGGVTVDLRLRGKGSRVARCAIDGREAESPALGIAPGGHVVEIHLTDGNPD